jgi:hypothetical protein
VILNLRLIVAGATVGGAVGLGPLLLGAGVAAADPGAPQLPTEQAAASDTAIPDGDNQQQEQAQPIHDNGLRWPLNGLDLPPAPFDVPPPPPLDIPPPPEVPLPPAPAILLPPPPF